MNILRLVPTYLAPACAIASIVLVCIINAAGNSGHVTGSHAGRVFSPGMNILEFHFKNTTDATNTSWDDDPYWAWKQGYSFRWYLNSAWMQPNFTSTEVGAQSIYKGAGEPFDLTRMMRLAFELAPGLHKNKTPPVIEDPVGNISTLTPFACYIVGIVCLFLAIILRLSLSCLRGQKGASNAVIGIVLGLSVVAFATVTAASGYLTRESHRVVRDIVLGQYVTASSLGTTFLGLAWGAVGASALYLGMLALDVMMWRLSNTVKPVRISDDNVSGKVRALG